MSPNRDKQEKENSSSKVSDVRIPALVKTGLPPLLAVGSDVREESTLEDSYLQKPRISHPVGSPIGDRSFMSTSTSTPQTLSFTGNTPLTNTEAVSVVPSRILNPHFITQPHSSTTYKVSRPTTTQSGSVQVIDLTRDGTRTQRNGVAAGTPNAQALPFSVVSSSSSARDGPLDPFGKISDISKDNSAQIITRNGAASTPTKGIMHTYDFLFIDKHTYQECYATDPELAGSYLMTFLSNFCSWHTC